VTVHTELTTDQLLTTTRSVRRRLDLSRPVPRAVVEECLRLAFQAPNGSNRQMWGWVLVDDPGTRAAMSAIYAAAMDDYVKTMDQARRAGTEPPVSSTPAQERMSASVYYLRQHFHEVPVLVVPTIEGRFDGAGVFEQASRWGSILPGVWSFMLALRSRGMGSAWTTLHLHREAEMADLLGIPVHEVTQAGMFPVAYTIGEDFRPADRTASDATVRWNHW
jgi:nitroreductase